MNKLVCNCGFLGYIGLSDLIPNVRPLLHHAGAVGVKAPSPISKMGIKQESTGSLMHPPTSLTPGGATVVISGSNSSTSGRWVSFQNILLSLF